MTLATNASYARRCAVSTCASWTNHASGVCPRCRERGLGLAGVQPEPIFDRTLVERTTARRQAANRTSKRERKDEEHAMQVALVDWCRTGEGGALAQCLARIVAIPNGGSHSKMMNIRMWQEGRAKGFPDLMLPVPRGGYHGAFLELKAQGEVPTADQFYWLRTLAEDGHDTTWTDDLDTAKRWLLTYATAAST